MLSEIGQMVFDFGHTPQNKTAQNIDLKQVET